LNYNRHKLAKRKDWSILYIDDDNKVIGTKDVDGNLYGMRCSFMPKQLKIADGSVATTYRIGIQLHNAKDLNENFAVVNLAQPAEELFKGIHNVTLEIKAATPSAVWVEAFFGCDKQNMFDYFEDELADPDAWSANGVGSLTGVTKSPVGYPKAYALAISLATSVSLATPDVLATLGIGTPPDAGYESEVTRVTITS
jgi:hypothetical protein